MTLKAKKSLPLKDIALSLKAIEEVALKCKKCGKCQPECPVFRETGYENLTARSKLSLISSIDKKLGILPSKVGKSLSICLLCGRCKSVCTQGIDTSALFLHARLLLDEFNKKSIFKKMIIFIFMKLPFKSGKKYKSPEIQTFSSFTNPLQPKNKKIIFFSGCLFDKFFPDKTEKAKKILKSAGFDVDVINGKCCGLPHLTSGNKDAFLKSTSSLANKISSLNADIIVSGCPTCTMTLKQLWPKFFDENFDFIKNLTVLDFHQLLAKTQIKTDKISNNKNITWHNPCHFKSIGIKNEPEKLLHELLGYNFIKSSDICCGFGGSFSIDHPLISHSMGKKKLDNMREDKSSILATGCPACIMQLKKSSGFKIEVLHTIDIMYEALIKE